jgi:hypothetical protein
MMDSFRPEVKKPIGFVSMGTVLMRRSRGIQDEPGRPVATQLSYEYRYQLLSTPRVGVCPVSPIEPWVAVLERHHDFDS